MEQNTSLAAGLTLTQKQTAYDAICRRLLSEKIILANILQYCAREFKEIDVQTIAERCIEGDALVAELPTEPDATGARLQGMGEILTSPSEGDICFDIYFNAVVPVNNESIQLIINVETQNNFYPGYPLIKRAVYYCSRMISAQNGQVFSHSQYGKMRKVYSIWICTRPPQDEQNSIAHFHFIKENMIGKNREVMENYDMISIIMIYVGKPDEENYVGVIKLLGVLLSAKLSAEQKKQLLQREFSIPMTEKIEMEVSEMFNFSQTLVEESEARGEARGIEIGEARGFKIGSEQTSLKDIRNLMKTLNLTAQEAMQALCIPENEREGYLVQIAQ
ncbi:MAG: PD-(D/E)XK nuclease family transposase [bacterium]|nr:PD-(D/E)XK nuclease family transposase [bacterium]